MVDNECPKDHNNMDLEFSTHFPFNVASLVTGYGVEECLEYGGSFSLPINLLPMVHGITAIDRLYPIKPKQPE